MINLGVMIVAWVNGGEKGVHRLDLSSGFFLYEITYTLWAWKKGLIDEILDFLLKSLEGFFLKKINDWKVKI